jgi:transposase, IS30 family
MQKIKTFNHLNYEERVRIECLRTEGKSIRYIAGVLGRSPNTISYELKNNQVKDVYTGKKAQHKSYVKRYYSKRDCLKIVSDKDMINFVHSHIGEEGWSPERMAGRLTLEGKHVSAKAIYKYIYSRCLEKHLFWTKNRSKSKKGKRARYLTDKRKLIDNRGDIAGLNHFEIDFVVSSHNSSCLLVIVDKVSRKVIIERLQDRKYITIENILKKHCFKAKSITTDNDISFTNWMELESVLQTQFYFTHPYSSWEKGLVENTNRWIRIYLPKKTDFKIVTDEFVKEIEHSLNNVPRQILGFKTANEVELEMRVS